MASPPKSQKTPPAPQVKTIFRPISPVLLQPDSPRSIIPNFNRYPTPAPNTEPELCENDPQQAHAMKFFHWADLTSRRPDLAPSWLNRIFKAFPPGYQYALKQAMDSGELIPIPQEVAEEHSKFFKAVQDSMKHGVMTHEMEMDRWRNIMPNEVYRVGLRGQKRSKRDLAQPLVFEGPIVDKYINASDILPPRHLSGTKHNYISCQAPKASTEHEMWEMVWQHHSEVILFLTNFVESGRNSHEQKPKAEPYWPYRVEDDVTTTPPRTSHHYHRESSTFRTIARTPQSTPTPGSEGSQSLEARIPGNVYIEPTAAQFEKYGPFTRQYGPLHVTFKKSTTYTEAETTVREFHLKYLADPNDPFGKLPQHNRTVTMLHFTGWPDFHLPSSQSFFNFMVLYRGYRNAMRFQQSAVIAHCSAGVGRSGCFIAIDMMIDHMAEMISAKLLPDLREVASIVCGMRACRPGMVQTSAQYSWLFYFLQFAYTHPKRVAVGLPPNEDRPLLGSPQSPKIYH